MTTASQILDLFEADLEFKNIYEFHSLIGDGFPVSWAASFFRKTSLESFTSELLPELSKIEAQSTLLLSAAQSQTLLHLARVYSDAFALFESQETTEQWLINPSIALGNKVPMSLLDTSVGFEQVSDELHRLAYGIAG